MAKYYSVDLRKKVLQYLEKNEAKKATSAIFQVVIATIYRWIALKKAKGNLSPLRRPYAHKKLIQRVEAHPDHFLSEIAHYIAVTPQAIFYAMKRLKITRKKRVLSIKKGMNKSGKNF